MQALAFEDGSLVVEAAGGSGAEISKRLSQEAEDLLGELGWESPSLPSSPNWRRVESTTSPDIDGVATQMIRTLRDGFGLKGRDQILITLFASPKRGATPASEQVNDPTQALEAAAPRRGFKPTIEEWADYYRQLYPGYVRPESAFARWKYATTAISITKCYWEASVLSQRFG